MGAEAKNRTVTMYGPRSHKEHGSSKEAKEFIVTQTKNRLRERPEIRVQSRQREPQRQSIG